jgi:hypothetical protein
MNTCRALTLTPLLCKIRLPSASLGSAGWRSYLQEGRGCCWRGTSLGGSPVSSIGISNAEMLTKKPTKTGPSRMRPDSPCSPRFNLLARRWALPMAGPRYSQASALGALQARALPSAPRWPKMALHVTPPLNPAPCTTRDPRWAWKRLGNGFARHSAGEVRHERCRCTRRGRGGGPGVVLGEAEDHDDVPVKVDDADEDDQVDDLG